MRVILSHRDPEPLGNGAIGAVRRRETDKAAERATVSLHVEPVHVLALANVLRRPVVLLAGAGAMAALFAFGVIG